MLAVRTRFPQELLGTLRVLTISCLEAGVVAVEHPRPLRALVEMGGYTEQAAAVAEQAGTAHTTVAPVATGRQE